MDAPRAVYEMSLEIDQLRVRNAKLLAALKGLGRVDPVLGWHRDGCIVFRCLPGTACEAARATIAAAEQKGESR